MVPIEVHIYDALKVVDRGVGERTDPHNARVVDENVDGGMCLTFPSTDRIAVSRRYIRLIYPDVPVGFTRLSVRFPVSLVLRGSYRQAAGLLASLRSSCWAKQLFQCPMLLLL
jgi:hypothetical protein